MTRSLGDLLVTAASSAQRAMSGARPGNASTLQRVVHVHRFRRAGDDPFSSATLYACRCGVVRPGM
jgi:hypothetical protein